MIGTCFKISSFEGKRRLRFVISSSWTIGTAFGEKLVGTDLLCSVRILKS